MTGKTDANVETSRKASEAETKMKETRATCPDCGSNECAMLDMRFGSKARLMACGNCGTVFPAD